MAFCAYLYFVFILLFSQYIQSACGPFFSQSPTFFYFSPFTFSSYCKKYIYNLSVKKELKLGEC